MGDKTSIAWTNSTWNPIRALSTGTVGKDGRGMPLWGCEKVSPGCDHCYASSLHVQHGGLEYPKEGKADPWLNSGDPMAGPTTLQLHEPTLNQPLRWARPRMIFVCSMTDLFGKWVPDSWLEQIFRVMERRPEHTFQVLTKRPQKMIGFFAQRQHQHFATLPNVWYGASVESQPFLWRWNWLSRMPDQALLWISAEPLLGPIDFGFQSRERQPDWIVVGGESGAGYRAMDPDWARSIRSQCILNGVPFFYKQSSAFRSGQGRELDGMLWEEYPQRA